MKYLLVHKFCEDSGYTERAVRLKIQNGVWIEGREYRRAPDGHIMINVEGVEEWVEKQPALSKAGRRRSGSSSDGTTNPSAR